MGFLLMKKELAAVVMKQNPEVPIDEIERRAAEEVSFYCFPKSGKPGKVWE